MNAREPGTYIELDNSWADPGWVRVPNTIARCTTISRGAKGFVLEVASHTPGHRLTMADLISSSTDGRDATRARITELEQAGFLTRYRERDTNGRLGAVVYRLHVTPQTPRSEPETDFPALAEPTPENPTLVNPVTSKKTKDLEDKRSKDLATAGATADAAQLELVPSGPGLKPAKDQTATDGFDQFWSVYPRKIGKGNARRAWTTAIKKAPAEQITRAVRRFAASRKGQDPTFTPHAATWLNGERWADEPEAVRNGSAPGEQRRGEHGEQVLVNGRWVLDRSALPASDWRRFSEQ